MGKRQQRRRRGKTAREPNPDNHRPDDADVPAGHASSANAKNPPEPAPAGTPPPAASRNTENRLTLSDVFGTTFWVFAVAAMATGTICWLTLGPDAVRASLDSDVDLIIMLLPRFGAGMLIAALLKELLPRERIARYVGEGAGLPAIGIATVVGAMTPGGPMTSFPIVRALREAGTGRGPLVAYVTSWSTLGFQRVLNWELPLLGPEFTALRAIVSAPLPVIAGLMSRLWPPARPPEQRHD